MKNNNRLYYLLTAGTLTVLLFATYLLFGGNFLGAVADAATIGGGDAAVAGLAPGNEQIDNAQILSAPQTAPVPEASLTALQAQNAKLIQMVQTMQERERQYQAQLQAATQALEAPQTAPAGHDYGESEHNEHERAEHGEHEEGGEDD
ncbi:MAG: hypothetical protein DYG89_18855 [Caldilinea sp. CFX5]|nr:hypothetical protein [Caldilinea sp. CFX5]